jgi:hypothetical protein
MMTWWGWGDPDVTFPMADKPKLWPWIVDKLGIASVSPTATPVVQRTVKGRRMVKRCVVRRSVPVKENLRVD